MSHARDLAGLQKYLTDDVAVKEQFMDSDTVVSSALKTLAASTGTKGFATPGDLPAGAVAGAQAYVTSNKKLYLSNGSGWYNIALINNTPYFTTSPDASYTLDKTGIATVVTILGADSDGHDIPQYSATGDSGFNAIATVTKDSDNGRVFVIKSIDSDGSASKTDGSGVLTFTLSDGKDSVTANSSFSIVFGFNWNGATLSVQEFPNLATASGDRYGTNVTQSGDGEYWATIGKTNGAAELRIFNGRTGSATQQYAGVSPAGSGDFGSSMDMNFDGDALIIASSGSNSHKKAYIYTRSGSTWSLAYTDNGDNLSGTVYPCQGTRLSGTGLNQRAFFRYLSNRVRVLVTTDGWSTSSQEAMIDWGSNNSNAIGDIAVSKDGSRLVQSYANATTSLSQIGQLKVWTRSGSTWSLEATLNETSPTIYAGLGQNVSMARDNGDVIIASMNEEGDYNQGGVVIFTRSGTNWSQAQKFSPYTSNPGFQARVGVSSYSGRRGIEISGDGKTMVVVNPKKTVPASATEGGSFFILSDTGSNFTISHTVDNAVNDAYRGFGTCASISNDGSTIAIGIVSHDGTYTNGGNVALYTI
jgi:hypothetical protein